MKTFFVSKGVKVTIITQENKRSVEKVLNENLLLTHSELVTDPFILRTTENTSYESFVRTHAGHVFEKTTPKGNTYHVLVKGIDVHS
jgi:hypothetical protein